MTLFQPVNPAFHNICVGEFKVHEMKSELPGHILSLTLVKSIFTTSTDITNNDYRNKYLEQENHSRSPHFCHLHYPSLSTSNMIWKISHGWSLSCTLDVIITITSNISFSCTLDVIITITSNTSYHHAEILHFINHFLFYFIFLSIKVFVKLFLGF